MDTQPPLILLVDNDPDGLEILSRLLELVIQHAEIVAVDSGTAALAVTASRDVALVITDYRMPEMNGIELATAIKAASPATCIAIVSALDPGHMEHLAKAVAVEYVLPKPFNLRELQKIITDCFPSGASL